MSEYIRVANHEKVYGQKNLLEVQYGLVKSIKHLRSFQELRRKELVLQIAYKRLLEEAINSVNIIDKILPRTAFKMAEVRLVPKQVQQVQQRPIQQQIKREPTIEDELDMIKKKLSKLQS